METMHGCSSSVHAVSHGACHGTDVVRQWCTTSSGLRQHLNCGRSMDEQAVNQSKAAQLVHKHVQRARHVDAKQAPAPMTVLCTKECHHSNTPNCTHDVPKQRTQMSVHQLSHTLLNCCSTLGSSQAAITPAAQQESQTPARSCGSVSCRSGKSRKKVGNR